jgi:hypothetical protein
MPERIRYADQPICLNEGGGKGKSKYLPEACYAVPKVICHCRPWSPLAPPVAGKLDRTIQKPSKQLDPLLGESPWRPIRPGNDTKEELMQSIYRSAY